MRKSSLFHNSVNFAISECSSSTKRINQEPIAVRHLRHDAWEMEHLGCDVGQIAVEEDKKRLNDSDVVCETGGEGRYESQEDADEHPANSHDEEVRDARKHIDGVDGLHLAEWLEQVVQDLGEWQSTLSVPPEPETSVSIWC